jgi:hypothetical protein
MQQLAGHRMCTLFAALIIRLDIHTGLNIYLSGGGELYSIYAVYMLQRRIRLSVRLRVHQTARQKKTGERKKKGKREEGRKKKRRMATSKSRRASRHCAELAAL